jgi:hypothetical protein
MGRNPRIEKIFQAWFELENCDFSRRQEAKLELYKLLDVAVAQSEEVVTRDQILDLLFSPYKEFRAKKHRDEKLTLQQAPVKSGQSEKPQA